MTHIDAAPAAAAVAPTPPVGRPWGGAAPLVGSYPPRGQQLLRAGAQPRRRGAERAAGGLRVLQLLQRGLLLLYVFEAADGGCRRGGGHQGSFPQQGHAELLQVLVQITLRSQIADHSSRFASEGLKASLAWVEEVTGLLRGHGK